MPMYIELRYCETHVYEHWQEVTRDNKVICRGENISPTDTEKTYAKRSGKGYKLFKMKKIGLLSAKSVDREAHISQLQVDF